MGIIKQAGQQIGSTGKGVVRQIISEPLEMLKDASQQISGDQLMPQETGKEGTGVQPQTSGLPTVPLQSTVPKPSTLEQNKNRILAAHRQELEDQIQRRRQEREQATQQRRMVEEKHEEEARQEEEAKKESLFEKTKNLITGKAKKRIETRMPKAA